MLVNTQLGPSSILPFRATRVSGIPPDGPRCNSTDSRIHCASGRQVSRRCIIRTPGQGAGGASDVEEQGTFGKANDFFHLSSVPIANYLGRIITTLMTSVFLVIPLAEQRWVPSSHPLRRVIPTVSSMKSADLQIMLVSIHCPTSPPL